MSLQRLNALPGTTVSSAAPGTTRSSAGTESTGSIAGQATTPSRPQDDGTSSPATASTSGIRLGTWQVAVRLTTAGSSTENSLPGTCSGTARAGSTRPSATWSNSA